MPVARSRGLEETRPRSKNQKVTQSRTDHVAYEQGKKQQDLRKRYSGGDCAGCGGPLYLPVSKAMGHCNRCRMVDKTP
jgi:hypothetical protein